MRRFLYAALVLAAGCGAQVVQFRPTERVMAESAQGNAEAVYDLVGPQGRAGEAKIWTPGIRKQQGHAVVPVGIEIKNTGLIPISIDPDSLRLAGLKTSKGLTDVSVPTSTLTGATDVAPRSMGDIGLVFTLPGDIDPGDVQEFRVEWTAQIGPETYAQFTPFVQSPEAKGYYGDYYGSAYGYYDGYWPFVPFYAGIWLGYPFGGYGCPSWYAWDCAPAYYYGGPQHHRPVPAAPPPRYVPRRPILPVVAGSPPPAGVVGPRPGMAPVPVAPARSAPRSAPAHAPPSSGHAPAGHHTP